MYSLKDKQKQLSRHTIDIVKLCGNCLQKVSPGSKLILFGSYACGNADSESDLDLLILTNGILTGERKRQIQDMLYEISLANDIVVSTIIKSSSAWQLPISKAMPIYKNIQEEGIAII